MSIKRITENVYEMKLGKVNAFLVADERLTLIDTGTPYSTGLILEFIKSVGRRYDELDTILLTHSHPDHAGSVAELQVITGAKVYMHAAEKAYVEKGFIPKPSAPYFTSLVNKLLYRLFLKNEPGNITPATVNRLLEDGDWVKATGSGIQAIHIPGHSKGQLAFFMPGAKNVLFAADAADNMMGLSYSIFYEDIGEAERSLEKLSTLDFDVACFGHGASILRGAADKFRKRFRGHHHTVTKNRQLPAVEEEAVIRVQEPEEKI